MALTNDVPPRPAHFASTLTSKYGSRLLSYHLPRMHFGLRRESDDTYWSHSPAPRRPVDRCLFLHCRTHEPRAKLRASYWDTLQLRGVSELAQREAQVKTTTHAIFPFPAPRWQHSSLLVRLCWLQHLRRSLSRRQRHRTLV